MIYAPRTVPKPDRPVRCCGACKTPWMCGNQKCTCHSNTTGGNQ